MSTKQVHFTLSPVHFPGPVLEEYQQWIPPIFLSIYRFLRLSLQTMYKEYAYDAQWDSISTMFAKLFSDTSVPHFHKQIVKLLPLAHQFRYKKSVVENEAYRLSLIQFGNILSQEALVKNNRNVAVPLWKEFNVTSNDTIGILESKLLAMFSMLQWSYQAFFDTTPYYLYFNRRYHHLMHPELLNILKYYAVL